MRCVIDGIKVIGAEIPLDSPKTLRDVGDKVRDSLGSGVAVLGGSHKRQGGTSGNRQQ